MGQKIVQKENVKSKGDKVKEGLKGGGNVAALKAILADMHDVQQMLIAKVEKLEKKLGL